jgi:hypothetical protein
VPEKLGPVPCRAGKNPAQKIVCRAVPAKTRHDLISDHHNSSYKLGYITLYNISPYHHQVFMY